MSSFGDHLHQFIEIRTTNDAISASFKIRFHLATLFFSLIKNHQSAQKHLPSPFLLLVKIILRKSVLKMTYLKFS